MPMNRADAIVLRTTDFSETSLVVHIFTRSLGKIAALAKGAKRLKGPFENSLDLLAEISVAFIHKNGDALDLLTESKLVRRFTPRRDNLAGLHAAYLVVELVDTMLEDGEPMPSLFDTTVSTIRKLCDGDRVNEHLVRFEWELLHTLGHTPLFTNCVECGRPCDLARDRSLPIGIAAGGVLCPECRCEHTVCLIPSATIRELITLNENTEPLSSTTLREARRLFNAYFCHLIGRPPKLYDALGIIDT
ncbi:MAG: DNA repair protein RecO [Thermoguttaceae bacterium]